jgi:hypothetical protein
MLTLVANAAMKEQDFDLFQQAAGDEAMLVRADDRALVAVQGPEGAGVLARPAVLGHDAVVVLHRHLVAGEGDHAAARR